MAVKYDYMLLTFILHQQNKLNKKKMILTLTLTPGRTKYSKYQSHPSLSHSVVEYNNVNVSCSPSIKHTLISLSYCERSQTHSAISGGDIPHVYGASLMIVLSRERLFHALGALGNFFRTLFQWIRDKGINRTDAMVFPGQRRGGVQ